MRAAVSGAETRDSLFASTRWSVVRNAAESQGPTSESLKALSELCQIYWRPLYLFLRRRGIGPEDAQDLTQGFFAELVRDRTYLRADRAKGRFRSFLLGALNHFVADARDGEHAQKRGGGKIRERFDEAAISEAENQVARNDRWNAHRVYDRAWAETLLRQSLDRLTQECAFAGKAALFEALRSHLSLGMDEAVPYDELAARMQISSAAPLASNSWARGARFTDENGTDAIARFRHNLLDGYFDLEVGRNFTTEGSFVNEGLITIFASDPGFVTGDTNTTLTISGNYTGIGYPLDPNTDGLVELLAPGPNGDARMVINGALTNYDAATQTLHKSYWLWEAAGGRSAITKVLGGKAPLDIVTSDASLNIFGPKTGFRDKFGSDALRNLAVSARLLLGDQNFTTANNFTSTSRLSIYGDTRFEVQGHLTIRNGFFEITPLTGYARQGEFGFPNEPPYINSSVIVRGNFNLPSASILRFHVLNKAITATMNVKGAAVFAGALQAGLEDLARVDAKDSFTVLTAGEITGQFSNVASGGRVKVYSAFDSLGNPIGKAVGTFRVTYDKRSLVLSDFQPR